MEHAAVFRGWLQAHEPRQLKALQTANGHGALYVYVIPKTALTIFNAYLAVRPPAAVSGNSNLRFGLWFGLAMLSVSWVSSALVQVPLQLRIQKTGDPAMVRKLNRTTGLRTLAIVFHGCSVLWILTRTEF